MLLQKSDPTLLRFGGRTKTPDVAALLTLSLRQPIIDLPPSSPTNYVEIFPDRLRFLPFSETDGQEPELTVTLDGFEALFRLAAGYHEAFLGVEVMSHLRAFREAPAKRLD